MIVHSLIHPDDADVCPDCDSVFHWRDDAGEFGRCRTCSESLPTCSGCDATLNPDYPIVPLCDECAVDGNLAVRIDGSWIVLDTAEVLGLAAQLSDAGVEVYPTVPMLIHAQEAAA